MTEKGLGVVQKISRQAYVLQLLELHAFRRLIVERIDRGVREREQDRRVGCDNELRVLRQHVLEHRDQPKLTLRRERRFRLIQEIQTTGHEPGSEQLEKALAVRVGVEVDAVASLHVRQ